MRDKNTGTGVRRRKKGKCPVIVASMRFPAVPTAASHLPGRVHLVHAAEEGFFIYVDGHGAGTCVLRRVRAWQHNTHREMAPEKQPLLSAAAATNLSLALRTPFFPLCCVRSNSHFVFQFITCFIISLSSLLLLLLPPSMLFCFPPLFRFPRIFFFHIYYYFFLDFILLLDNMARDII